MQVERLQSDENPGDRRFSRYRITPDGGSAWDVEIAQVGNRFIWRLQTEAMQAGPSIFYRTEEYALNAAVKHLLDIEAASQSDR